MWPFTKRDARSESTAIEIVKITPSGPPVGYLTKAARRFGRETHPLIGSDVNRINSALLTAFTGTPATLQDLFDDLRDRDDRLDSVARTRILAIQSRRWTVKPLDPDDLEGEVIAERVTKIIRSIPGWRTRVGEFADGILRGYSASEIEWFLNAKGEHAINGLHWIHPNRLRFDDQLRMQITDPGSGASTGLGLDAFGPDKFVMHAPNAGRAAYVTRRGVLIACLFPALTKRFGLRWWLQAAERFGQPAPYIKVPDGAGTDVVDKAIEMLRQLTADWQGVISEGMEVNALAGSTGQFTGECQARLVELVNTGYAIQLLGQNLTTEVAGGSFAAAESHQQVRGDILSADLAELDDTITAQIVEPIVRYNWPGASHLVYETQSARRMAFTIDDLKEGVCTADEYRESKGYGQKPDGQGAEFRAPLVQVPGSYPAASQPLGSAAAADPFRSALTKGMASSPTSTHSTHPLANALLQRWVGPAQ